MNSTRKVVRAGILSSRQSLFEALIIIGSAALLQLSSAESALAQQPSDGFQFANCPPETRQKPQNCQQVAQIAYALATKKKGYADAGGNGIPDVMERRYVVNVNDCSTGNAHAACMFNDPCTAPIGRLMGLRSNSARHATVLFEGTDGSKFECDFTPQSSGIAIAHRADTRIGPAFPDPGESMDPAYDCLMNGANTRPLNAFGGGGGALQSSIMTLLMQMLQQQLAKLTPAPSPAADAPSILTPTPTPTPKPLSAVKDFADKESSQPSLDAMDLSENGDLFGDENSTSDSAIEEDVDDEGGEPDVTESTARSVRNVWDKTQGDVF